MEQQESITRWIEGAKQGDEAAVQELWNRYFEKLVHFARRKLDENRRRIADEEDIAIRAFKSFCQAAREGRFPHLKDRDDLWRLLLKMTARKAIDQRRYEGREKRRVFGESALGCKDDDGMLEGMAHVIGDEPTPEFSIMVAEECEARIERLGDEKLRAVAMGKLEGRSNEEIARNLDVSIRTVERQLHLIRKKWEAEESGKTG